MTHLRSFSGLNWVSGELYEVIRKARDALEEFVEGGGETTVLGPCVNDLNQVRGVLEMLQLFGAARLAEEMHLLAEELRDDALSRPEEAAEALMLAMIQLPDYLEKLESGGDDIPLLLLPAINDLRSSRGGELLSEADLLVSGMVHSAPQMDETAEEERQLKLAAQQVRPRIHKGLLAWFRDPNPADGIRSLGDVFTELETLSAWHPMLRGVFRTAHAVTEALIDGSIESDKVIKGLVGRIDRIIKIIAADGPRKAVQAIDRHVMGELIAHVAKARSDSPVVQQVKADYDLEHAFPSDEELAEARKRLLAPSADALDGIRNAAIKELLPIKDTLDLYMRGGRDHADRLQELEQPLRRLANTLQMAELGDLGDRLRGRAADLASIGNAEAGQDDALLMRIAGDLLYVESSLDNLFRASPGDKSESGDATRLPQGEIRGLINKTLDEAAVDMAKAKEAIGLFLETPTDIRPLDITPALFHEVAGALRVIAHNDAAAILDDISSFIKNRLVAQGGAPDARSLDALADSITGLEYYMEAVAENRADIDQILNLARSAVGRLQVEAPMAVEVPVVTDAALPPGVDEASGTGVVADSEMAADSEFDAEIMEIFLEEAQEELPIIEEYYTRWKDDPDDEEALSTFRRSFHTLKGSGRLAGAMTIGDFAWAVESLLNRVIDQTLSISDDICLVLDRAVGMLPELIEAQQQQRPPELDVADLIRRANELAEKRPATAAMETPTVPAAAVEAEDTEESGFSVEDTELREIFSAEAAEHLDVIRVFLDRCESAQAPFAMDDELIRSFHTLAGSARMAGLDPIAEVAKGLERKVTASVENGWGASSRFLDLLADGFDELKAMVATLAMPDAPPLLRAKALVARIEGFELVEQAAAEEIIELPGGDELALDEGTLDLPGIDGADEDEPVFGLADEDLILAPIEPGDALESLDAGEERFAGLSSDVEIELEGLDAEDEAITLEGLELPGVEADSSLEVDVTEPLEDALEVEETIDLSGFEVIEEPEEATRLEGEEAVSTAAAQPERDEEYERVEADEELVEIFLEEGREIHENLVRDLAAWRATPRSAKICSELQRSLHTLKGASRLAGVHSIGNISHGLENLCKHAAKAGMVVDDELALAHEGAQFLAAQLDALEQARPLPLGVGLLDTLGVYGYIGLPQPEGAKPVQPAEPESEVQMEAPEEAAEVLELALEPQREAPEEFVPEPEADAEWAAALESQYPDAVQSDEGSAEALAEIEPEAVPETPSETEFDALAELDEGVEPEEASALTDGMESTSPFEPAESPEPEVEQARPLAAQTSADLLAPERGSEIRFEAAEEPIQPPSVETPAPVPPVAEVEVEGLSADPELIGIFLEEAEELVDHLDTGLRAWETEPESADVPVRLKRTLHTLKGSARLAGISSIGDLSHALETLLDGLAPGAIRTHASLLPLAQRASDRLASQVDSVRGGGPVYRAGGLIDELEYVHEELIGGSVGAEAEPATIPAAGIEAQAPAAAEPVARPDAGAIPEPVRVQTLQEQVRVRSDLLNRLINNAGEISIYRSRLEEQNTALGFNLGELEQTVSRLHDQLRQMEIETEAQILYRYEQEREDDAGIEEEFDPLELDRFSTIQQLSRSLMETVNDLVSIKSLLTDQQKESETLLLQQSRISNDLQDGLLRTRMVPFTQLVPRLHRVVRQTANSLNKQAILEVFGAEGEMDRSILERMQAPMEHILRNAVSHGIEAPEQRKQVGKDQVGRISVYLAREGNDVLITVSDDGAGLNLAAIRKRAEEIGLLEPGAKVDDDDVMQLVLEPGFTTSKQVTQISGRGVGTDVVVSEVKQLGGSLEIESQPGRGTSFSIRLPFTLAISEALLVQLGDEIYAVPHPTIEGVVRISAEELGRCYAGSQAGFHYVGHDYHVRYLGNLLGTVPLNLQEGRKWLPLLLVRSGEHRVAIQIDHILGNRQIVVKSVGSQLSSVRWISGGTILADGRVALILDVSALVRMDVVQTTQGQESAKPDKLEKPVKVMVVDDSITVRKVTTRLLKRHNMEVLTAKDGVDAVAQLQEQHPDVMLLDIEMPRMDGYELARHMRNSSELRDIPIIMITSRSGEKHRNIALSLGVKRYLGKPYQEGDLLDNIFAVLAESEVEA